jgi:hypothetical protein
MEHLDRRFHPIREDLAAAYLTDQIAAPRYVDGEDHQVNKGALSLRRAPRDDAPLDTELLYGERVRVYENVNGWSWLQNETDCYVGYAPSAGLTAVLHKPTHVVCAVATFLYPEPDIKAPPLDRLGMGARVAVAENTGLFSRCAEGGWVFSKHLAPVGENASDHAGIALQFLGVPYLWGGKTSLGLDCSGLVQIALDRCGVAAPRDTDIQARDLGTTIGHGAIDIRNSILARGDLVFWPDHVGIFVDENIFVHANATDMAVTVAPLEDVECGVKTATGEAITDIRRL